MAIGIWNTAFLGDAVLTLPLIQTLHSQYPDEPIHFFVRRGLKPLFEAHPAIAEVHEFDKAGTEKTLAGMLRYGRQMSRFGFRLWLSGHISLRSALMARLSGARMRVGYKPDFPFLGGYAWAYTHTVPRHFGQLDEIERLLMLLEPLGIQAHQVWPEIVLASRYREQAGRFWEQFGTTPVLGMHPGSVWPTKRWPVEYFADIAARALQRGAAVMVFGAPGEEETLAGALERMVRDRVPEAGNRLRNTAGTLSLPELAAYLALLTCYLTNDSGPMHLAWTQLVPVTALFGPTTATLGFAPRGPFANILEVPLGCRPCGKHGHKECVKGHFKCMRGLSPETVWQDVLAKLFSAEQEPDAD